MLAVPVDERFPGMIPESDSPDWLRLLLRDEEETQDWKDPGRTMIGWMTDDELRDLRKDLRATMEDRPASAFLEPWHAALVESVWELNHGQKERSIVRISHEIDRRHRPDGKPDLAKMVDEKKEASAGNEIEQFAAITGIRFPWPRVKLIRCPLPDHKDGTPSFMLAPKKGFYCFGCKKGGSMIDFVKEYRGCSVRQAMEEFLTLP